MVVVETSRKVNALTTNKQTPSLEQTARYQAMQVLSRAMTGEQFLNDGVQQTISQNRIVKRDIALFTNLAYGTMQRHYTLERILLHFVARPQGMKRWTRELLLESLYQFYYLDHIPPYAIVNEAVNIAKVRGSRKQSGFVNGVLKNIIKQAPVLEDILDELATDTKDYRTLTNSLPPIWYDYFVKRWGTAQTEAIAESLNQPAPVNIRFSGLNKLSDQESIARLATEGIEVEASAITPHVYRVTSGSPMHSRMFSEGRFTIQDASAALAVEILDPKPGERVLDACAAPGGKTVQLAEKVGKTGQVIASDIEPRKLKTIEANVKRLHVSAQTEITAGDATQLAERFPKDTFDRILVDAPCSGIGLFRRKPDAKYHKQLADLKALQAIQEEILDAAFEVLKPGGTLLYSTCTITNEENHEVIAHFLAKHPEMQIEALPDALKAPLVEAMCEDGTIEILPHQYQSDGFFIAKLTKQGH